MWTTSFVPVEIQASDSLDGSCDNPCVVLPHFGVLVQGALLNRLFLLSFCCILFPVLLESRLFLLLVLRFAIRFLFVCLLQLRSRSL